MANGEILFGLDRYFYKKFDFQMDFLQKLGENRWRNFFPRIRLESFLTDDLLSNAIAMCKYSGRPDIFVDFDAEFVALDSAGKNGSVSQVL